jgi:hypothetical protein
MIWFLCAYFLGTGRITEAEGTLVVGSGGALTPVRGHRIKLRKFSFRPYNNKDIMMRRCCNLHFESDIWCFALFGSCESWAAHFNAQIMNEPC